MMATPQVEIQQQALEQPLQQQQQQQNLMPPPYQASTVPGAFVPPPPPPDASMLQARRRPMGRPQHVDVGNATDITPPLPSKVRPYNGKHSIIAMVVDRSGSMQTMGCEVSGGCNAYLEECLKGDIEDETTSSIIFTRFDTVAECLYENVPLASGIQITNEDVRPRGGTALYDAIGVTMQRTVSTLEKLDYVPKVVIFILTDGHENSSHSWSKARITKEITKLQAEPYNWDFYFAAANQDAMREGASFGMDQSSCITYSASPKSMSSAFKAQAKAHGRRKKGMAKGYTPAERNECME